MSTFMGTAPQTKPSNWPLKLAPQTKPSKTQPLNKFGDPVYVYDHENSIQGFAGLSGDYIEGLFVSSECQSCGIGALLLNHIKGIRTTLQLKVYQKNTRAIRFYLREGFEILSEGVDEATGEKEYVMIWQEQEKKEILGLKGGSI